MKKIETVYIAGPYTPKGWFAKHAGSDTLMAVGSLVRYALDVFFAGYDPFCPGLDCLLFIKKEPDEVITEAMIKRFSKSWLKRCDALMLTPGWYTSDGCIAELKTCIEYDIPVFRDLDDLKAGRVVDMNLVGDWVLTYPKGKWAKTKGLK